MSGTSTVILPGCGRPARPEEARSYQQELGCQCTYECAMSVNTLFNPRRAARILWNSF